MTDTLQDPMFDIQQKARAYRKARDVLSDRATTLHDGLEQIKRRALPGLRSAVASVTETGQALKDAIGANPNLFIRPRTVVFEGLKLGFQKGKGKIEWADDDRVVLLIKRHIPEAVEVLIKTKETPVKEALGNLSAADLKRIGVTVESVGDVVVIKDTTAPVDKLVAALLKGAEAEAGDQE